MDSNHPSDAQKRDRQVFTRRALLLGLGQAAILGALGARLYQLQVLDADRYSLLADDNRFNTLPLAPVRGRIVDRFGVTLASNEETFRVSIVPALAGNIEQALDRLGLLVTVPAEDRLRIIARARRQAPNLPILVASDLSWDQVAAVNLHAPELPGIDTETFSRRIYDHSTIVGHIVGHVGAIERFAMGDEPVLRIPGMRVGRAGVERGMDRDLRGLAGDVRREVDVRGRIVRNVARTEAIPGDDLALTIDLEFQRFLTERVKSERRAAVVALDVETGEVIGMASSPGYDPALNVPQPPPPESPAGRRRARALRTGRLQVRRQTKTDALFNRATNGLYPPGSTFKIVTALAALESGAIDLRERIDCHGSFVLADKTFRCWNRGGHGRCDMHRALRESCDVYFYEVARRMGIEAIAAMARRMGLGQTFDAGIAPLAQGIIPTPAWKRGRYGRGWLGGETILTSIGQGYTLTSPLQLAVMTARAATGRMVTPTLVRPEGGRARAVFPPIGINSRHLQAVQRALRAVVNETGGTGSRAFLTGGPEVAGKTGTSQVSRRSANRYQSSLPWEERDHALFVGYFPANAPRYAVSAVIEHGGGGGAVAAPLVQEVMAELVARDPSKKPAVSIGRSTHRTDAAITTARNRQG